MIIAALINLKIEILTNSLILAFITFGTTIFILKNKIFIFERLFLDIPNARSSHKAPVPSGGGIVFSILGSLSSLILGNYMPFICLPLSVVGLIDDRYKLSISFRYLTQVLIALILMLSSSGLYDLIPKSLLGLLLAIFIIFCSTAIINFTNFMDGIDGLVSGCMIIFISTGVLINNQFYLLPLISSLFAFLLFNWNPAKIFMGDAGSLFLGVLFSGIIMSSKNWTTLIGLLLISTPLMADAFFCTFMRLANKELIFKAHKKFLFQRLNKAGWSQAKVSKTYIIASLLLSFAFIFGGLKILILGVIIELSIGIILNRRYAEPF